MAYQQIVQTWILVARKGKEKTIFTMKLKRMQLTIWLVLVCPVHTVHNAIKTCADCLPIDFQLVVNKIYQHFHICSAQVKALSSFCELTETECKTIGAQLTSWLSLLPAGQRITDIFPVLKSYFLFHDKCPVSLQNF